MFFAGGVYNIEHIFRLDGIYGRYRWRTIAVYLFSILIQIPFVSLSFYVGPLARLIGAHIACLPELLVPAVLYCLIERRIPMPHVDAEEALARAELLAAGQDRLDIRP
jgi:NCS1 family nucleobase:cation symporter-1